jgi:SAM-dependent methyltransferase
MSHRFDPRWSFYHQIKNKEKILELGCGPGNNYTKLQSIGFTAELHGVDILPPSQVTQPIRYRQVDLVNEPLPYPDNSFDAILFTHVIEHLNNPFPIGKEIYRVLKPGGRIYIETPNWTSMFVPSFQFKREQYNPFNFFDDPTHIRPWSKMSLYGYLTSSCQLSIERIGAVRNWFQLPWDLVKIISGLFGGNRKKVIAAFWSVYGWAIFGIGIKKVN